MVACRPEVALADLIRALRVATLWWLCGAIEQVVPRAKTFQNVLVTASLLCAQMCLFVLLCGPTGGLGVSAVFALRQPFAAVVSTIVPLSAQWTGVPVMFTQWMGVALLMVLGVAEVIAFYKRLDGRPARPGVVRAPGGNNAGSAVSGFVTPKAVKAGAGKTADRSRETDDTKASADPKEFETKNPADHDSKRVINEAKKRK